VVPGCIAKKRGVGTPFPHQISRKTDSPARISTLDLPVSLYGATLLYTRKRVIYSFVLLQALHVEIEMTNINLKVTILVRKGAGTPFPPHYTPACH